MLTEKKKAATTTFHLARDCEPLRNGKAKSRISRLKAAQLP